MSIAATDEHDAIQAEPRDLNLSPKMKQKAENTVSCVASGELHGSSRKHSEDGPKSTAATLHGLSKIIAARTELSRKRIQLQDQRRMLRAKRAGMHEAIDMLLAYTQRMRVHFPSEEQEALEQISDGFKTSKFTYDAEEQTYNIREIDLDVGEYQLAGEEAQVYDLLRTEELPSAAQRNHIIPITPAAFSHSEASASLIHDMPSADSLSSFEHRFGTQTSVGNFPSIDPGKPDHDLHAGNSQQTLSASTESEVKEPSQYDNGRHLRHLLLDFKNSRDRINRWLLHKLRVDPFEMSVLRHYIDLVPDNQAFHGSTLAEKALACWNKDICAQGGPLEPPQTGSQDPIDSDRAHGTSKALVAPDDDGFLSTSNETGEMSLPSYDSDKIFRPSTITRKVASSVAYTDRTIRNSSDGSFLSSVLISSPRTAHSVLVRPRDDVEERLRNGR